jgi:hypothetical protein
VPEASACGGLTHVKRRWCGDCAVAHAGAVDPDKRRVFA